MSRGGKKKKKAQAMDTPDKLLGPLRERMGPLLQAHIEKDGSINGQPHGPITLLKEFR